MDCYISAGLTFVLDAMPIQGVFKTFAGETLPTQPTIKCEDLEVLTANFMANASPVYTCIDGLVLISSTFYEHLLRRYFCAKKMQSQNVTREKLL